MQFNLPPPSLEGRGDAIFARLADGGPSTLSSWSAMLCRIKSHKALVKTLLHSYL